MGTMCETHEEVMIPDICPERNCPGGHGYTTQRCGRDCPQHPTQLVTIEDVRARLALLTPEDRALLDERLRDTSGD
jgi:hypothetical protein